MENGQKQGLPVSLRVLSDLLRNDGHQSFLLSQTPSEVRKLIKRLVDLQNITNVQLAKVSFQLKMCKWIISILSLILLGVLLGGMR